MKKRTMIDEAVNELVTLQDILRWSVSQFNATDIYYGHGSDNPWDEAHHLVLSSLHLPLSIPAEAYAARLTLRERQYLAEQVYRRIYERIPAAYLTQQAWFCGLEFYVNEHVLIPRSPLAEMIKQGFDSIISKPPTHILDMCTGSGCIAVACAYTFPEAEVDAVDISQAALQVAEHNIQMHGLEQRVFPIYSDLFDELVGMRYDVIITNPPYVDKEDMADLPAEYQHEPTLGLAAGEDGLTIVKQILAGAADHLNDGGILICEVGNSAVHLIEQYPTIPFQWQTFSHGGEGVFVLDKQALLACQTSFSAYRKISNKE